MEDRISTIRDLVKQMFVTGRVEVYLWIAILPSCARVIMLHVYTKSAKI